MGSGRDEAPTRVDPPHDLPGIVPPRDGAPLREVGKVTCPACHHQWRLLPAHVVRTAKGLLVQCPRCGSVQKAKAG
jgi:ssDNA-binding Zn-finger/Zn-ribbon topoisomerase 1